ncbi:MAG: YggT family protein [Anaerolineales bacterium]|nr:YggT family protein [Anaerolineales bacterium]MCB8966538.1 YggT family protein [Ardenticatenaceae bacterium]
MVQIINLLFNIFYILILARIIFSWIRVSPYDPTWGPIMRFVYQVTDPIMEPIRRIMPPMGGLDFSPMIVLILASVLRSVLVNMLI